MDLFDCLKSERERASSSGSFVSLEFLERNMTWERFDDHLNSKGIQVNLEFKPFLPPKRLRLFAILVLLKREQDVSTIFGHSVRHGIMDDTFFFCEKEEVPLVIGNSDQRAAFFEQQAFFPPLLKCEYPLQKLPGLFNPPPFMENSQIWRNGSFGIVRQVKVVGGHLNGCDSNEYLAWKAVEPKPTERDRAQEEVKTLISRRHKHIVALVACYSTSAIGSSGPALNLLFPWAEMDMSQWMKLDHTPDDFLREPRRRKEYLYDTIISLLSAVTYLHREINGSITSHHDLKPSNILLFGSEWKIGDFGKSHLRDLAGGSETEGSHGLGSYVYQPPEWILKNVKGYGRSFDIWSMGCIIVELAVLVVHGWETQKLSGFATDRAENPSPPSKGGGGKDMSFHNNLSIVHEWMVTLEREDGSHNFAYLMKTALSMLSTEREDRPCSWEVELDLYEQFHPDDKGSDRRAKMEELVQPPKPGMEPHGQTPLVRALAQNKPDRVKYLQEKGWTFDLPSAIKPSVANPTNTFGDVVSLLDELRQLFTRSYVIDGYRLKDMAIEEEERRRKRLTRRNFEKLASEARFCSVMRQLNEYCDGGTKPIPGPERGLILYPHLQRRNSS